MADRFGRRAEIGGVRRTALERYALLETLGDYWDGVSARPQEVVVRFGEASLILLRFDDVPVAHWALASLRRVDGAGPGEALLTPDPEGDPDADERLILRDPMMIEAIEAVCTELDRRPSPARGALRLALWTAAALAVVAAAAVFAIPFASDRLAAMIPAEQEVRLGEAVQRRALALMSDGKDPETCAAPDGLRALDALQNRLLAAADIPVPVEVIVVRSPEANSFAAPGGRIALFSGLVEQAEGPEEVAAVLAHELGHAAHRDPTRTAFQQAGTGGLMALAFGGAPDADLSAAAAGALVSAGYSQAAEAKADAYAFDLLARAGLPASALAAFFERAGRGPATALSRHLSSHPDLAARAEAARSADAITGAFQPALEDDQWLALRDICRD